MIKKLKRNIFWSVKLARPVEEVLEDQKRFIADASHELKTPVAIINADRKSVV